MTYSTIICRKCPKCSNIDSGSFSLSCITNNDLLVVCRACLQAIWVDAIVVVYEGEYLPDGNMRDISGDSACLSMEKFIYDEKYNTVGGYLPAAYRDFVAELKTNTLLTVDQRKYLKYCMVRKGE